MVVMCLSPTAPTGNAQERTGCAVDVHRAGAALRDAAPEFCTHQPQRIPQHPKQGRVGIHVDIVGLPVNGQPRHKSPPT